MRIRTVALFLALKDYYCHGGECLGRCFEMRRIRCMESFLNTAIILTDYHYKTKNEGRQL